jgi:hypothetical protein
VRCAEAGAVGSRRYACPTRPGARHRLSSKEPGASSRTNASTATRIVVEGGNSSSLARGGRGAGAPSSPELPLGRDTRPYREPPPRACMQCARVYTDAHVCPGKSATRFAKRLPGAVLSARYVRERGERRVGRGTSHRSSSSRGTPLGCCARLGSCRSNWREWGLRMVLRCSTKRPDAVAMCVGAYWALVPGRLLRSRCAGWPKPRSGRAVVRRHRGSRAAA